ncbi:hypothetical protein AVEN_63700-1 [Araneus ventricosus]|uniref:Uncharacterized protein n=1 Tax=Araneus ventricosus TaxID=182803 RepID=A0A4Y2JGJ5_ARAVE|nr:hypothetical protein AVEN_63700-1 [Araneus ventricosus]
MQAKWRYLSRRNYSKWVLQEREALVVTVNLPQVRFKFDATNFYDKAISSQNQTCCKLTCYLGRCMLIQQQHFRRKNAIFFAILAANIKIAMFSHKRLISEAPKEILEITCSVSKFAV